MGGFFASLFDHFHQFAPDQVANLRAVSWQTRHAFQQSNIARWVEAEAQELWRGLK